MTRLYPYRRPNRFVTETVTTGPEVDLRREFDILIYGGDGEIPHGFPVIVRHMRRDANGNRIDCTCRNSQTRDADPDCSYCYGVGTLFDEQWHITYREYLGAEGGLSNRGRFVPPGEIRADFLLFYFRYDTSIVYGDQVVEVELDTEGNPVVPYVRSVVHIPRTIDPLRSDYGRIEYIVAYCKEDEAKRRAP